MKKFENTFITYEYPIFLDNGDNLLIEEIVETLKIWDSLSQNGQISNKSTLFKLKNGKNEILFESKSRYEIERKLKEKFNFTIIFSDRY